MTSPSRFPFSKVLQSFHITSWCSSLFSISIAATQLWASILSVCSQNSLNSQVHSPAPSLLPQCYAFSTQVPTLPCHLNFFMVLWQESEAVYCSDPFSRSKLFSAPEEQRRMWTWPPDRLYCGAEHRATVTSMEIWWAMLQASGARPVLTEGPKKNQWRLVGILIWAMVTCQNPSNWTLRFMHFIVGAIKKKDTELRSMIQ